MADQDLNARILKQVEYYFSPQNLPKDAYLQSKMNDNMEVSLTTISDFRKVQELTHEEGIVAEALAESAVLVLKEGMIGHKHAVNDKKSFVIDVTVHNQEVTVDNVKQLVAEAGEAEVVLEEEKKKMNDETNYSWVVTLGDEELAKKYREQLDKTLLQGGTIKTKLRITYDRSEDEQIRLSLISSNQSLSSSAPYRPKRIVEFPSTLRALLIGRQGANIKKLTEKYPGLHIDTRYDDTNIVVYADSEEIIAKALVEIETYKTAPPPEAEKKADGAKDEGRPAGAGPRGVPPSSLDSSNMPQNALQQQQMMLQQAAIAQAQATATAQAQMVHAQAAQAQAALALQQQQQQQQQVQQQQQQQQQLAAMQQLAMRQSARMNQGITQDANGEYSREFQIPSTKTGLMIGRKGCQKQKIEEQFRGIRIKVTTEDTKMGLPALVCVTAADPRLVQTASAHILATYGSEGTVPPSQANRVGMLGAPQSQALGMGAPGMGAPGMGGVPGFGNNSGGVGGGFGMPGGMQGMGGMGGGMGGFGAQSMNPMGMNAGMPSPMMGGMQGMNAGAGNPMMNAGMAGMQNSMGDAGLGGMGGMHANPMGGAGMGGAMGGNFGARMY